MRRELSPAALGSLLLHATVGALLLISWNFTRDLKVGSVVPVTIVSQAPAADLRPAVEAPQEQSAMTEAPAPDAPPEAMTPAPLPRPTPPTPVPTPKPKPKPILTPVKPTPTPKLVPKPTPAPTPVAKPSPAAKPEKSLDLDALAASVSKSVKPMAAKPSSAAKGATRPEGATQARPTTGTGLSALAMSGLTEELQRRWNPNCDVEGGRNVQVRVTFTLGAGGQVVGNVASQIKSAQTPVALAAAERAVRAVYAAAPFRTLPSAFYGDKIAVNFNAREACS